MVIKFFLERVFAVIRNIFIIGVFFYAAPMAAIASSSQGQEIGIAAIVGDSVISSIDLNERIKIAIFSSNIPAGKGFEEKIKPQVLHNLIDEKLYIKEAANLDLSVTKEEIDVIVADIEQRNHIQPGKFNDFLKFKGMSVNSMMDQLRAQLIWNKVLARKIRPQISITDKEVNEKLENITRQTGTDEVNISEILLPADNEQDAVKVREVAQKLAKQLRSGGDFVKIAKQFSKASSAQNGGNVGWIRPGQIPDEAAKIIKSLQKGQVSEPLTVPEGFGYTILKLNDRREISAFNNDDAEIGLRHAFVVIEKNSSDSERKKIEEKIKRKQLELKNCNDFVRFAKDVDSNIDSKMVMTKISSLALDLRDKISKLKIGEFSTPLTSDGGLSVYMVCEKTDSESTIQLKNKLREGLLMRKLEIEANKYLRDLRRSVFIEIRKN